MRKDFVKIQGGTSPSNFTQGGNGRPPPFETALGKKREEYVVKRENRG